METCQTTRVEHMFHIFFDELFKKAKGLRLWIEHEILYELLLILRQIAARGKIMGGLNFREDGVWCWYKLCMSIRHLYLDSATHPDLVQEGEEDASIMRRFCFEKYYYPSEYLSVNRGQKVVEIITTTRPNTKGWVRNQAQSDRALCQDFTTRDWWNIPLDAWDLTLVHKDKFFHGVADVFGGHEGHANGDEEQEQVNIAYGMRRMDQS
ncbi:hypothetical protein FHETE_392 [Fusarium heterosporum]|uniref:Uncharacterized protein n=1 Tax=Fusarium heterosporum TaxID=42747 RepID=A0A8H5U161_FUSHE|nr:hypothetical protein FHETE_392 [Fusarium heterosporum]